MKCYSRAYPEPGEFVVVRITSISDMGVYASLLEYDNIQGMIPIDELSVRKSSKKLVVVDKIEVALVLSVDVEKGYIDLSKKRVSLEDVLKTCDRWYTAKEIHRQILSLSSKLSKDIDELYKEFVWSGKTLPLEPVPRQIYHTTINVVYHRGDEHLKEALLYSLSEDVEVRLDQSPSYHITALSESVLSKVCSIIIDKIHHLGGNAIIR